MRLLLASTWASYSPRGAAEDAPSFVAAVPAQRGNVVSLFGGNMSEKRLELRKKIATAHGVTLEEYDSPEYKAKLARQHAEFERQEAEEAPFIEFDKREWRRLEAKTTKSGGVFALCVAIVAGYTLWQPDIAWKIAIIMVVAGVASFCFYFDLVYDAVKKVRSGCLAHTKSEWASRWLIYSAIKQALLMVAVLGFLLLFFHAFSHRAPCHPNCHWCKQAIEDFKDRDPPERRP